ncbi:MAG: tetratricopeptide repeat protein [Phycisphaeraceae bacterium]|nr:tetratricopeptide repeat protein [Phycisphaeraceae bacterium]
MGWFGKKKQDDAPADKATPLPQNGSGGGTAKPPTTAATAGGGEFEYSPDKAGKFFERATTLHEATNFGYAMQLWLGGLRQDPTSMAGLEGFMRSATSYMADKKYPEKDIVKQFSTTKSDLDRYLYDLLMWGCKLTDAGLGVRAMQAAAKLGLAEPAVWIADRAAGAASREKRPRKDHLVACLDVFEKFQRFDKAVVVGEAAVKLDPTDGRLAQRVKNLSAESTMHRGGFDQAGQAGGFRQNVRDASKQRQLEDQDRVVKTEETLERMIEQARTDHQAHPQDRPTILRLGNLLKERGRIEDEQEAQQLYQAAFEATDEYRFKELGEQITLNQARRRVGKLKAELEKGDESAREALKRARQELLAREIRMLEDQVRAYPTDLIKKFHLGRAYFATGRYDEAVALLQEAKADPKHRSQVLNYLGLSFLNMEGYTDEAIETLRQALSTHDTHSDDVGTELRYGLMLALGTRARENNDLADAEEAFKIAAGITIQNISYKDVRKHRDEIKGLIAQIKAGAGAGGGGGGA